MTKEQLLKLIQKRKVRYLEILSEDKLSDTTAHFCLGAMTGYKDIECFLRKKNLYTTSEYISTIDLDKVTGGTIQFFSSAELAERDAKWLVNYYKKDGIKKRKPVVYRVKLEKVKIKK